MSTLFRSRRLRWIVPGGVAAAVAVASLTSSVTASASGRPKLPPRTAAQLLVTLDKAKTPELSGTVVETTHLGLPDLSALTGSSGSNSDLSLQNFVSGSHTLRVFYGGPDKQRLALLGTLSESDIVHNGKDLWTYSSSTHQVEHGTLPKPTDKPERTVPAAGMTPMVEAQKLLAAIDPSTAVTIDRTAYVAGRPVYQVLISPKDSRSLIGSVRIALDSATSMPLRVQVFAAGAKSPAIQVGFTDVHFGPPNASVFDFVKPAGTTVKPLSNPLTGGLPMHAMATPGSKAPGHAVKIKPNAAPGAPGAQTKVIGSGWTTVVEYSMPMLSAPPAVASAPAGSGQVRVRNNMSLPLTQLSTPVAGGRVIRSALVTVFLTADGRVFAGPVSLASLQKVAATGKAL